MAPVPPPPAPAPAPNLSDNAPPVKLPNKAALLKSIEKGTKLKKAVTNDRSAPLTTQTKSSNINSGPDASNNNTLNKSNVSCPPTGLGGLFSNGFPKLRSVSSANEKKNSVSATATPSSSTKPTLPQRKVPENTKDGISTAISETLQIPRPVTNAAMSSIKKVPPGLASKVAVKAVSAQISESGSSADRKKMEPIVEKVTRMCIAEPKRSPGQERWAFPNDVERKLPKPREFRNAEKIYLSNARFTESKPKTANQMALTEDDLADFIIIVKKKLKQAADDESFEDCVRLKAKLKGLEALKDRVKHGEKVYSSELPQ